MAFYPDWQEVAQGGAALFRVHDPYELVCSGAFINRVRTAADFTPLFVTAGHCVVSGDIDSVLVTCAYQTVDGAGTPCCPSKQCPDPEQQYGGRIPDISQLPQILGATLLVQIYPAPDIALLGPAFDVPAGVTWLDSSSESLGADADVAGIHRPRGSSKRVAFRSVSDSSVNYYDITWPQGNGLVERASSDSPLIDQDRRIRGVVKDGLPDPDCDGNASASYSRSDAAYDSLWMFLYVVNPVYVDSGGPLFAPAAGRVASAFRIFKKAIYAVIAGGDMYLEAESYNAPFIFTKPVVLHGGNGLVAIGE